MSSVVHGRVRRDPQCALAPNMNGRSNGHAVSREAATRRPREAIPETNDAPNMNGRSNGHTAHHEAATGGQREASPEPYIVLVSARFLITSLLACCLLAFCVGRAVRITMLRAFPPHEQFYPPLPSLVARNGEKIPRTRYMSKNFDTARSASSSSWLATSRDNLPLTEESTTDVCSMNENVEDESERDNAERQLPVAAHLMVDIKNVDGAFLDSESRLANAMVEVVNEAELTLLSYHCHGLVPMGVSCVGVLLQNYMSFHTWPEKGVITLDLCVGGTTSLLPVLTIIERLFGVPRTSHIPGRTVENPEMRWAHKIRGYPDEGLFPSTDLGLHVLNDLGKDVKEKVVSLQTQFQRIDIYDVLTKKKQWFEGYKKALSHHGSHESRDQPLLGPDRIVMLDGWIQSTLKGETAYHEALVHPAMFFHSNPKRVAIIGGGEGATLREVLKHNTVREVIMIEIDEMMVNVSRDHIPEWNDCSDLVGSTPWCADDPRARLYYEDALSWFMDRYSDGDKLEEPMDIIVMDALALKSEIPFAKALYSNETFTKSFYDSLSDDGILVMQLGQAADQRNPDETHSKYKNRATTVNLLEHVGFRSIHAYEESHCGFMSSWTYIVAFKSHSARKRWYANAAEIEVAIQKRSVRTKSGMNPFRYFDGPTMVSYQVPPRAKETVFCRGRPAPSGCFDDMGTYYYLELDNVPKNHTRTSVFNPAIDRHLIFMGAIRTNRDITAGVFDNYLKFSGSEVRRLVGEETKQEIHDNYFKFSGSEHHRLVGEVTKQEKGDSTRIHEASR